MGLKGGFIRNLMGQKDICLAVIFLSFTVTIEAQAADYKSTFVSHASKDPDGRWTEWTDWVDNNSFFEIDQDDDFITVSYAQGEKIYLIQSAEEFEDEDGDLQVVYKCVDEDFNDVTITLVERNSLEEERTEIYVDTGSESTAYIIEPKKE